ncbi:MAG: tetratricopeptide repeat protein, partial [Planctomycetes bacterium]|nr:tetratricopeptide repeat protein [Planctomycetota bacterium]
MLMVEWFKNLSEPWQIAIFGAGITVALFAVGGLIKWLFSKKNPSSAPVNEIDQPGSDNTAIIAENNKGNIAARDINTGIEPDNILDRNERAYIQLGQSKEIIKNKDAKIEQLEEQLAIHQLSTELAGESQTPQPSQEAKDIATQIEGDAGPYAQALKAIAEGDNEQADEFLDETQQFLDAVQEKKDQAQIKIYMARMQNASYAGRPRDALQYCDKLTTLAGDDTLIMNEIATVYHNNAQYQKAEPLMKRALAIGEASLGRDHPKVAIRLNNLAALYQATNRLKKAEPLYKRALTIDESSLGRNHLDVARDLNNLAQLYKETNRLKEAEPLMKRVVEIFEKSLG